MKKYFLLFNLFWVVSTIVTYAQGVNVGVRGGLNVARVTGDIEERYFPWSSYSQKPRIGFNVGLDARSQLSAKITLQAELVFSTEGAKASGQWTDSGEGKMKSTQKLGFLSLPLFVKYNFTSRFYVMGGPQVSYLVSSKYEQESIGNGTVTTTNNLDAMNKFGFGIVPVLGYDFDKFSLGIRYYAGLSQLNKDDNLNRSLKSEVLSVVLRYTLFDVND